jgi:hypothetical protein
VSDAASDAGFAAPVRLEFFRRGTLFGLFK